MLAQLMLMVLLVVSAQIKGPTEWTEGELAVLDGSGSQGDRLQWVVPPNMRTLESKTMKLGLVCDQPGKYVVMLIAVDKALEIAVATQEITVKARE